MVIWRSREQHGCTTSLLQFDQNPLVILKDINLQQKLLPIKIYYRQNIHPKRRPPTESINHGNEPKRKRRGAKSRAQNQSHLTASYCQWWNRRDTKTRSLFFMWWYGCMYVLWRERCCNIWRGEQYDIRWKWRRLDNRCKFGWSKKLQNNHKGLPHVSKW